jgi:hypothetical protein
MNFVGYVGKTGNFMDPQPEASIGAIFGKRKIRSLSQHNRRPPIGT